jgi:hypothetical protein
MIKLKIYKKNTQMNKVKYKRINNNEHKKLLKENLDSFSFYYNKIKL